MTATGAYQPGRYDGEVWPEANIAERWNERLLCPQADIPRAVTMCPRATFGGRLEFLETRGNSSRIERRLHCGDLAEG